MAPAHNDVDVEAAYAKGWPATLEQVFFSSSSGDRRASAIQKLGQILGGAISVSSARTVPAEPAAREENASIYVTFDDHVTLWITIDGALRNALRDAVYAVGIRNHRPNHAEDAAQKGTVDSALLAALVASVSAAAQVKLLRVEPVPKRAEGFSAVLSASRLEDRAGQVAPICAACTLFRDGLALGEFTACVRRTAARRT